MKNTLVLLGLVAGIVAPLSAQADPESLRSGDSVGRGTVKSSKTVSAEKARDNTTTIYITNVSVTGSHLPLVVSRYKGHYDSSSPITVYGRPDLDRTGQLSVGGELAQREPSISVGGSHR